MRKEAVEEDGLPPLSYVSHHDGWLRRNVIGSIEVLTGRPRLLRLYREIQEMDIEPHEIWGAALAKLRIQYEFPPEKLAAVPASGPLVIIANHPFGVVDGLLLGHLASLLRPKFHFLVNALLVKQDPRLNQFLLPISFEETKEALQTNLASRQASIDRIREGEALVIFPGGGVATAPKGWGRAEEFEWKRFPAKMIQQAQATVLPVYFHGQNSRIFHLASRLGSQFRLGFLLHEIRNKIGREIPLAIGDPIPWQELAAIKDRQALLDTLQARVMALAPQCRPSPASNRHPTKTAAR